MRHPKPGGDVRSQTATHRPRNAGVVVLVTVVTLNAMEGAIESAGKKGNDHAKRARTIRCEPA